MFLGPDSMGFVWGGVGQALMQFMHLSGIFGMLAVLATSVTPLRGVSGDGLTVYAYKDMKGRFLQSLALPRAGQTPCQKCEMTVCTNNGLVNGPVHNLLMQFFTLYSSKIEVFETYFFDAVIP